MTEENKETIIEVSESFIHLKSNSVPNWVKNLEALKLKIREKINNPNSSELKGIKFVNPLNGMDKE